MGTDRIDHTEAAATTAAPADDLLRRLARWRLTAVLLAVLLVPLGAGVAAYAWAQSRPVDQASAEVGFARDMFAHHEQAVVMSSLLRNVTDDPTMNTLAHDIITSQAEQQGMMLGWLRAHDVPPTTTQTPMAWMSSSEAAAAGHQMDSMDGMAADPQADEAELAANPMIAMGMATDEQLSELGRLTGVEAEVRFMQLMLRHHEGGLAMAQAYLDRGDDPELTELATGIVTSQQREIDIMTGLLADRGATL